MSRQGRTEGYPADEAEAHQCLPQVPWLQVPGINHLQPDQAPNDYLNQSTRLLQSWPRPKSGCKGEPCSPDEERCPDEEYKTVGKMIPECDRHHLFEMMAFLHDLLRHHAILYWATFGTLLGAHREGGHIGHETDVDITVRRVDLPRIRRAFLDEVALQGLPYIWYPQTDHILVHFSQVNKLHIDIWYADITFPEPVHSEPVQAMIEFGQAAFSHVQGFDWQWAWSTRLKVRQRRDADPTATTLPMLLLAMLSMLLLAAFASPA